jgi:hypothetical protein
MTLSTYQYRPSCQFQEREPTHHGPHTASKRWQSAPAPSVRVRAATSDQFPQKHDHRALYYTSVGPTAKARVKRPRRLLLKMNVGARERAKKVRSIFLHAAEA